MVLHFVIHFVIFYCWWKKSGPKYKKVKDIALVDGWLVRACSEDGMYTLVGVGGQGDNDQWSLGHVIKTRIILHITWLLTTSGRSARMGIRRADRQYDGVARPYNYRLDWTLFYYVAAYFTFLFKFSHSAVPSFITLVLKKSDQINKWTYLKIINIKLVLKILLE